MSERIRSFLAVEITEELKGSLAALVARLNLPQFHIRWVRPEKMHLTLRFLGDISREEVKTVSGAARTAAGANQAFFLKPGGLGSFPASGAPHIVWAGIKDEFPLLRLERRLTRELTRSGWPPPDKAFRPHLTLGRVKNRRGIEELRKHLERNRTAALGQMLVDHLSLIKSVLRPSGPIYTTLDRFVLPKEPQGGDCS